MQTYARLRPFLLALPSLHDFELSIQHQASAISSNGVTLFDNTILRRLKSLTVHGPTLGQNSEITETIANLCPSLEALFVRQTDVANFGSLFTQLPTRLSSLSAFCYKTDWFSKPFPPTLTSLSIRDASVKLDSPDVLGSPSRALLSHLSKQHPQLVHLHISVMSSGVILPPEYSSAFLFPELRSLVYVSETVGTEMEFPTRWINAPQLHTVVLKASSVTWQPLPSTLTHLSIIGVSTMMSRSRVPLRMDLLLALPRSLTSLHLLGNLSIDYPSDALSWLPSALRDLAVAPTILPTPCVLPPALERFNVTYAGQGNDYLNPQSLCAWSSLRQGELRSAGTQLLKFTAPSTLKELETALCLPHAQLESLPPALAVLSMPASADWDDQAIHQLLNSRPSIRRLRLDNTLMLPSPSEDLLQGNDHFDFDQFETQVNADLISQHRGRLLTFQRTLPARTIAMPDFIKLITIGPAPDGRNPWDRDTFLRLLAPLPCLTSLRFTVVPTNNSFMQYNFLEKFPSLEELYFPHATFFPFDLSLLPRSLRLLHIKMQPTNTQSANSSRHHQLGRGFQAQQTLQMGTPPQRVLGDPKLLPPNIEELFILGINFSSESILKWPKTIRALTFESDAPWSDADLARLHSRLPKLARLSILDRSDALKQLPKRLSPEEWET